MIEFKSTATHQEVIEIFKEHTKDHSFEPFEPLVNIEETESKDVWYIVSFSYEDRLLGIYTISRKFMLDIDHINILMAKKYPKYNKAIGITDVRNFLQTHYVRLYKQLGSIHDYEMIVDTMYEYRGQIKGVSYGV
ncbi:MAG: hypothetical protein RBT65_17030 [Methanolobus sp.]|nr:hypothetical protein [Methanolobus sp.]